MLLAAKMLEPGKSTMTIEYLGQKFIGDLLPDGKIKSQETETIFCSPSAWAMHCKRIINPEKKSGCGWASVKYKGKKLDAYKAQWLRKCQMQKDGNSDDDADGGPPKKEPSPEPTVKRCVLPHNTISNRNIIHDTNTLVETVSFAALNKIQPFLVSITTSSVLLMDFHCHLTKTEVSGYLGGSWDVNSHTLAITHAFPCRNSKHDRLDAAEVELDIQRTMLKHNLMLVGWYHSHPKCAAQPTLRDCDAQLDYQIKMRGASEATYSPCVGLICSPYNPDNPTLESTIMSFWVVPPPENRILEYGRPMLMSYSVHQDTELSKEVHTEMDACIDYYKRFPQDMVDFLSDYTDDTTYIEKLKVTLYSKFPQHQDDHQFWNWLRDRLGLDKESEFTPPKWPAVRTTNNPPNVQDDLKAKDDAPNFNPSTTSSLNGTVHLDLTTDKSPAEQSKEDKLLIRTLQEQLSLPSGLNMNPSPISSAILLPAGPATSMSSNTSVQTSSSSPRDSPITIPSNSASPAKFEIPIRASPSPAKSDTSSTRTRNSPAPSPNKYMPIHGVNSTSGIGHVLDMLPRSSPSLSVSSATSQYSKYELPSTTISAVPNTSQQQHQQQQQDAAAAVAAQQQAQQISDYYSSTNYASLAKNLAGFTPSDYAMLFQSKDYGLASLNQLAASAGMPQLGANPTSSGSGRNHNDNSANNSKQSAATNAAASQSAVAAAMAGNMKDFLAQLEKSTELNYLMQSTQYNYPQLTATPISSKSKSKHDKSGSSSSSSSSRAAQQQQQLAQRQMEEDYKKDANKINEFMRSQEYATMLLEQAEALNASAYGMRDPPAPPPPAKKSRKSQQQQHQQQQQQQQQHQQHQSAAAAAAAFGDLTSLLQGSPKMHELSALFQSGKPSDLQALLQQQFGGTSITSTNNMPSSSHQTKKQQQQQLQQQQQQQQQQQLQDYNALFAHSKMSDLQSLMTSGLLPPPSSSSASGSHHGTPSTADLSALFSSALAGGKSADASALSASVDMLGSLLQAGGAKQSDLSSLLFSQANAAAELNNLFAASSSNVSNNKMPSGSSSSYYSQSALDKANHDISALYHNKYAAAAAVAAAAASSSSAIPDPLSKSTLASNNMFMNPNALYANMKLQQDALNAAMIMKPPKVSSSPSPSHKSRETSSSPAADKSLLKSSNRESPAMKYNFSAVDLAVSSVSPNNTADLSRKIAEAAAAASLDMSAGSGALAMDVHSSGGESSRLKKRMEFSSIADLVAPPSKMQKLEELANMHHQQQQHADDEAGSAGSSALNLSAND